MTTNTYDGLAPAQVASHDQAHPATALTPGAVIVASGQASEREIVERLARRGGWTSRRLDRTRHVHRLRAGPVRPNDSGAHSPEGRIEVAEFTKGSAQRPRYAHSLMQVLSFLREA